jgi:hypothetical protein
MKRLADWWFASVPAERLAALRILIGGYALVYVVARLPEFMAVARYGKAQFRPIGIVQVLDAPLPATAVLAIVIATVLLLGAFVAGFQFRITGPLAALALLWTITYRNVWGMIFHTENLLVLHVIALAVAPAAHAWSLDARRGSPAPAPAGYGWPIKLLAVLTIATYVLAGVAKLRIAGLDWIDGEQLRNQIAVDNLRKALLGDGVAPLAYLVLERPSPLIVFSVLTLAIELGAPLALVGRRLGHVWVVSAWGFHAGVVLLMNIWFPYPLFGFAFLPLLPAERGVRGVIGVARGIRRRLRR